MAEITKHHAGSAAAGLGGGCAALFGSIFIFAGLAVGVFLYFPAILDWWQVRSWEEVPCRIESADVRVAHGEDSTTYEAQASYSYQHGGQSFRGERVGLMGGSDNFGDFQQRRADELRTARDEKRTMRCFVNPQNPAESVLFPDLRWGLLLLMSLFPTLFPLAGGFVAFGGIAMAREAAGVIARQRKMPDAPWKWKSEWADDAITASRDGVLALLALAGWILLVQSPLAAAVIVSGSLAESLMALFAFLPSAIAFFPLRAVLRRLRLRRILGKVSLVPQAWPLRPGEVLEGRLRFSRVLSPMLPLAVRVRAVRKVTRGSGKNSSTSEETLWEHTETLHAAEAQRDDRGCAVPLRIELTPDAPGTDVKPLIHVSHERSENLWTLEVLAGAHATPVKLPLPVFGEASTEVREASKDPLTTETTTEQLQARLQSTGVKVDFDAEGIPRSFECPPGRNRALAVFLLFFGTIWFGAMLMMFINGAPFIFRLVWGLSAPAILVFACYLLVHHRRVDVAEALRIVNRAGPFYSKTEILGPRHVVQFIHDNYMRSGNTHLYRIRAETTFGKKITLVDGITEEATAEKLAQRLTRWKRAVE
jgi:hypothetical protein